VVGSRASAENFPGGGGGGNKKAKSTDREIAPITQFPFYQWRVSGHTGHAPRDRFKGTLHQEPCV